MALIYFIIAIPIIAMILGLATLFTESPERKTARILSEMQEEEIRKKLKNEGMVGKEIKEETPEEKKIKYDEAVAVMKSYEQEKE